MLNQRVYNPTLNPDLWDESDNLKPEVLKRLLKVGMDFYEETELPANIKDIILIGSSVNYNWTPNSDIDVHVVIDVSELGIQDENVIDTLLNSLKFKWNYEHDIKIKNHRIEVYIQDVNKETHSSGCYSLMRGMWIVKPDKENITVDKESIKNKYDSWIYRINNTLKKPTESTLKKLIDDLYIMRQNGLDKAGEYSVENIVFKILRNKGNLDKVRNVRTDLYDKKMGLQ